MRFSQRELRGLGIVTLGGQIHRLNDKLFHKFDVNLRTIVGNCWDYCSERGWRVQYIFVDFPKRTGKKHKLNLECMKQRVRRGDFDVVVFWNFGKFFNLLPAILESWQIYE
jgi:hypothetical protein